MERVFTTPRSKLDRILYASGEVYIFNDLVEEIQYDPNYTPLTFHNGFWGISIRKKDERLNSRQVIALYNEMEHMRSIRLYKKGKAQIIWGNILAIPSGYLLGSELYNVLSSNDVSTAKLIGSLVGAIASVSIGVSGERNVRRSVDLYNESLIVNIGGTKNGIGLSLSF